MKNMYFLSTRYESAKSLNQKKGLMILIITFLLIAAFEFKASCQIRTTAKMNNPGIAELPENKLKYTQFGASFSEHLSDHHAVISQYLSTHSGACSIEMQNDAIHSQDHVIIQKMKWERSIAE